ncbi:Uncharacterised protein [uncultured archaeon]|nr:Uncharacterised protein [uncultured archaeon]
MINQGVIVIKQKGKEASFAGISRIYKDFTLISAPIYGILFALGRRDPFFASAKKRVQGGTRPLKRPGIAGFRAANLV